MGLAAAVVHLPKQRLAPAARDCAGVHRLCKEAQWQVASASHRATCCTDNYDLSSLL